MSRTPEEISVARVAPRLAIIGCGTIVEQLFAPALRRISWFPSALIDTSPNRIDQVSSKLYRNDASIAKSSDWHTLVDIFDAALIVLPIGLQGATAVELLRAGKHVFLSVPLGMTGDECGAIIAAANHGGVILSVGLYRRYWWIAGWTKALLQSGTLGSIERFEVHEGKISGVGSGSDDLIPQMTHDGSLLDIGTHTLDLLLWWLGDAESVGYYDDSERGRETECILEYRLASGAVGRIEFSRSRNLRNSIRIEGTLGYVEIGVRDDEVLEGSPNALAFEWDDVGLSGRKHQSIDDLFDSELKDFRKSIIGGKQFGATGCDGAKAVDLIERCYAGRHQLTTFWMTASPGEVRNANETLPALPYGSKILVTGATGFVGGRLVERLLEQGHTRITCLIRDEGRASRLRRQPIELLCVDLCKAAEVDRAFEGVNYVFHCAYDLGSPRRNIKGLRNLLDACRTHSVSRFLHVSTFAVYEPFPDGPLGEDTRNGDRSNVYVDTKLRLEGIVFEAVQSLGVPATIIQPAIVYGPYCYPWTIAPAEMLIFGDVILPDAGEGLCNAVYIDDLVDSFILAAVSPAAVGERFIISGPEAVTWATFFSAFAEALGTASPKFWPRERIIKLNQGIIPKTRRLLSLPKLLIKRIIKWGPVRKALLATHDAMPARLRKSLVGSYAGSADRRFGGEIFVPNQQVLALYTSKADAGSDKARAKLGYSPQIDFQHGMKLTGSYLQWAYGDLLRSTARARIEPHSDGIPNPVQSTKSSV